MIAVELFYHCDRHGCDNHAYVPGEEVAADATIAATKVELPAGWKREGAKVYCAPCATEELRA